MLNRSWFLKNRGIRLLIDSYVPDYPEVAIDVETDKNGKAYCIALCGDLGKVFVYFTFTEQLLTYLRGAKIVGHNVKSDIAWMSNFGLNMQQVSYDTMLGAYTIQSTRRRFGLKVLAEEDLGLKWPSYDDITEDKMYIEHACSLKSELFIKKVKVYKTKPSKTEMKLPKFVDLPDQDREVVANYNGMDAYATFYLKTFQTSKATDLSKKFLQKVELPTTRILYEVEKRGIRVNQAKLVEFHKKYAKAARKAKHDFFLRLGKEILLTSPIQVKQALNDAGVRVDNTNEDTLIPYKTNPLIELLLEFRHNSKICTTYTKPLYKMAKASADKRIHCNFMQHTDTGRLACRRPNLQNQPPEVRECFEAAPGYTFVNADWSQIELRIPAHFSGEPLMVDTFINGKKKIHDVTAEQINRPYKVGKTVNFLLTNSGGPGRLAEVAEIPYNDAVQVMSTFWEKFSVLRDWTEKEKSLACRNGGIYTLFGRWVPIADLRSAHIGVREAAKRQAMSVKVQGSAADMMKVAMIKIAKVHNLFPVVTVHDELMFEVKEEDAQSVADIVKREMEAIVSLKVPLVADVGIGRTWADAKAK